MLLLIHPPVAKPSEPPAGLMRLAGALEAHQAAYSIFDANLEGLLWLLRQPTPAEDTWSLRAARHRDADLAALKSDAIYRVPARYTAAVGNLDRLLAVAGKGAGVRVGLANYTEQALIPQRSADLYQAFANHRKHIFYPFYAGRLPGLLEDTCPACIGISINYLNQALCAFALAGVLRQFAPGVKLLAGGGLVTSWLRNYGSGELFRDIFDEIVSGPGEETILKEMGVKGEVKKFYTPAPGCFPADAYLAPGRILPYNTSSGCFWNRCTFCPEPAEANLYFPVPPPDGIRDLYKLVRDFRPRLIHFCDNALSPAMLAALRKSPPGVPWYGFARIDEKLAEREYVKNLKEAGCLMLKLGLESGDPGVLEAMGKGTSPELISRVLHALRKEGIATFVYLLFGTPAEDKQAALRTLSFVAAHSSCITFLNLAVFNLPRKSAQAGLCTTREFYSGDLSLYSDFRHPSGWNRLAVRQFLKQEFRPHPAVAPVLKRTPPVFTSNHAPFFLPPG